MGLIIFMDETRLDTKLQFDWFGFTALAIGIGALQLALDRGEQLDWLESWEITIEFIVSAIGFYYFFAHSLTTKRPFVQFAIFKDRNFATALIFMAVIGVVLFSTMALASPLFQNAYGYPILTAGLLLATRGIGTFVAMMMVSRLMTYFEARTLIAIGLTLIAITLYDMAGWTADISVRAIAINSILQGYGIGLVFVPMTTAAFMTLPDHLRTDGTSMLTLVRNVASSIGISIVIARLTSGTIRVHAVLAEHINPFNDALQMPNVTGAINLHTDMGRAMMDLILSTQAQIIAFSQDFELVALVTVLAIPLALILKSTKAAMRAPSTDHAAVME
jgi:DHA2 family multidrug resistance protein